MVPATSLGMTILEEKKVVVCKVKRMRRERCVSACIEKRPCSSTHRRSYSHPTPPSDPDGTHITGNVQ